jgi:sulfur-oxidizing protein SoxZ
MADAGPLPASTPAAPIAPTAPNASTAATAPTAAAAATAAAAPSPPRAAPRALVTLQPATPRRGEPFDVRALVAHPMETGHRADALGRRVPRDIVRRLEARIDGELVFAIDLHPAIAANPYFVFPAVAHNDGELTVGWTGDRGFAHSVSVPLKLG